MAHIQHRYQPDYVQPPGKVLEEILETRDLSARELARRCGRSPKLFVEIIAGKAPIEPATAMQLERVLGMDASIWLNLEAKYRLHLAQSAEAESFASVKDFVHRFPIGELVQRGCVKATQNETDIARELLRFFAAGSFTAFRERFDELRTVSFRHSPTFKSDPEPLLAWLRLGELQAESVETAPFDRTNFINALTKIRSYTNHDPEKFLSPMISKCAEAGVVFLLIKPFSRLRLSGVARWLVPGKGIIQQTLRHKTNDHFWFTFFHEAAHLLLHSRKALFIDGEKLPGDDKEEAEANHWAANFLVPQHELEKLVSAGSFDVESVTRFSEEIDVAPGIVVGQLQTRKAVPWNSPLNHLKVPFEWSE
jgi:HTH-type transcriptional regulator/antitoxin HigA